MQPDVMNMLSIFTKHGLPRSVQSLRHHMLDGEIARFERTSDVSHVFGRCIFKTLEQIATSLRSQIVEISRLEGFDKSIVRWECAGSAPSEQCVCEHFGK